MNKNERETKKESKKDDKKDGRSVLHEDSMLEEIEQQLATLREQNDKISFETGRNLLRNLRKTHLERWDAVLLVGPILLKHHSNQLEEAEFWEIHEQLLIAALNLGKDNLAEETLNLIIKRFGSTGIRVKRLRAYILEAKGKFGDAEQIYKEILSVEPSNTHAMKRQIAMRKAQGKYQKAIQLLNEYLQIFMSDIEAWQELSELYLFCAMYKQAAFCYEEMILSAPTNHLFALKYAEILYTIGGYDNVKMARKYFARVVELSDYSSTRALYGILHSAQTLSRTKQGKQDKDNSQIYEWALGLLIDKYKASDPNKVSLITAIYSIGLEK